MNHTQNPGAFDVVLIGAGIMSATLGAVLKELEPSLGITIFETLEDRGLESSQAWNNAGTGHAANCELNYTPRARRRQRRHLQGARGQRRVRPVASALVLPGPQGCHPGPAQFYPSRARI